jgi:taurine transport system substrate-binding protein
VATSSRPWPRGDVQFGEAGSSPIAAAASQGQDIKLFWILDDIADAEALVARKGSGINGWKDLNGKKVATPFVSTSHYQLLVGLQLKDVEPKSVNVLNLRPQEIAAAWERGDIYAAFIWDPALSRIKANGKVIATSGSIGKRTPDLRRAGGELQVGGRKRGFLGCDGKGAGQGGW